MNSCVNFSKKYPLLIAALTVGLVYGLFSIIVYFPEGPLTFGLSELFVAIIVFGWTFLFMGKEKVAFSKNGFGYCFNFFKGYIIFMIVLNVLCVIITIIGKNTGTGIPLKLLNAILVGLTVGIVEEFSFRGLVFGGILQKLGTSKKNVIVAALVSGLIFGVMHIIFSLIAGELTTADSIVTGLLKVIQAGVLGIVFAFVYIKTRNLYTVAAIHGLNDFLLFIVQALGDQEMTGAANYTDDSTGAVKFFYIFFTIIVIPMLVKGIKELNENESIPFEDDFKPIDIKYVKKVRKS